MRGRAQRRQEPGLHLGDRDARGLRADVDRGNRSAVAIACSGFNRKQDVEAALEAGFDVHITKPIGVRDLVDVYRKLAALSDYPLHLGLTEAGMAMKGIVSSPIPKIDPPSEKITIITGMSNFSRNGFVRSAAVSRLIEK